jgi:hypothetical protein
MMKRTAGVLLGLLGMSALGIGLYFMLFRPAMLPEDIKFIGVSRAEVPARLLEWLGIVFRTWGGFMVGFGIVLVAIATSFFTASKALLSVGTAVGVIVAFGQFFLSNLALASESLTLIGVLFGLALATGAGLLHGCRRR